MTGLVSASSASAPVAGSRLVDGGLGTERSPFFQVLLDLGLLVVQVEVGADPGGDDLGAEAAGGGVLAAQPDQAPEDDVHLVRAADIDVVADQLLEEDPPAHRPVPRHGGGELDLLDRQLPAVVSLLVRGGERVRQILVFSWATPANRICSPPLWPARYCRAIWSLLSPFANRIRSKPRALM